LKEEEKENDLCNQSELSSFVSQQLRTILICDRPDLVMKAMTWFFALTRAR